MTPLVGSSEDEMSACAVLVICNGGFEGMQHQLSNEETIIGRSPTTDITLLDESISREHVIVSRDPDTGEYTLEDLQSTNGSKVNGKRVRNATLVDGDEIEVGKTKFKFILKPS